MSPFAFPARVLVRSLRPHRGGDEGNRTLDPLLAGQVLSQLSYTPVSSGLFSLSSQNSFRTLTIEQQLSFPLPQALHVLSLFIRFSLLQYEYTAYLCMPALLFSIERR